jgi:hypothetical protein
MAKVTVYSEYVRHLKRATYHEGHACRHFPLGYDCGATVQGLSLLPVLSVEHVRLYDWHVKQRNYHQGKAQDIKFAHLAPFQKLTDRLCYYAYNGGGRISEFKKARDKLWREQHKLSNAIGVANGRKPKAFDNSNYNLDFE